MKSNCIFFSIALYFRRGCKGYLQIRKTRLGKGPHLLYNEFRRGKIRQISYVPLDQTPKKYPPLVFKGRVKWGDL